MTNGGNFGGQGNGERNGVIIHMWLISLAISVVCCALFLMMTSFYVKDLNESLAAINVRLANIESNSMVRGSNAAVPSVAAPAPTAEGAPVNVDVPSIPGTAPASTGEPAAAAPVEPSPVTTTTTVEPVSPAEPAPAAPAPAQ